MPRPKEHTRSRCPRNSLPYAPLQQSLPYATLQQPRPHATSLFAAASKGEAPPPRSLCRGTPRHAGLPPPARMGSRARCGWGRPLRTDRDRVSPGSTGRHPSHADRVVDGGGLSERPRKSRLDRAAPLPMLTARPCTLCLALYPTFSQNSSSSSHVEGVE